MPFGKIKRKKEDDNAIVRYLSADEEARLRTALIARDKARRAGRDSANKWRRERGYEEWRAYGTYTDHLTPLVLIAVNTGLRRGELLQLSWRDVDLQRRMLTVRGEGAKTGQTRHVPLNSEAVRILTTWKPAPICEAGWCVFSGADSSTPLVATKKPWMLVLKAAKASQVLDVVQTMGGRTVGEVLEGQRRFALQARFVSSSRSDVDAIKNLKVADPQGRMIPLSQLADIIVEEGPAQISRENIHRKINIEANVRGRDLGSFVADVQRAVGEKMKLPPSYYVEYGGQFENLQRASRRLSIVVPLALLLIFMLLYTTFNAVKPAVLIYFNIPIAATGGLVALFLRGMPFSISAGVGFIALFGVAVLNGVVMISYFRELTERGMSVDDAVRQGAELRLRPVLMTALVAGLGFVPMALSSGAGAEVQRPLATVVIGGLLTSTALTLLVLPSLYRWFERGRTEVEI